jgi:hypothetical protein
MKNAPASSESAPAALAVFPPSSFSPPDLDAAPMISVENSQSTTVQTIDGFTVHPVPTLDGFGLLVVSLLLGAAAFWIWRKQQ